MRRHLARNRTFLIIALTLLVVDRATAERLLWELPDNDRSRQAICPRWAFEMWMWEDDQNTARAVTDYVEGCAKHDLPLRAVLIDSPPFTSGLPTHSWSGTFRV